MLSDTVDYEKGETPMTDLQYQDMKALREENDALKAEIHLLRGQSVTQELEQSRKEKIETPVTNQQFDAIIKMLLHLIDSNRDSPELIRRMIVDLLIDERARQEHQTPFAEKQ